jgi:hypothetical protein
MTLVKDDEGNDMGMVLVLRIDATAKSGTRCRMAGSCPEDGARN